MSDFLAMGGHGAYVWTAYGISLLTLAAIGSWPLLALRAERRKLERRLAAEAEAAEAEAEMAAHGEDER